MQNYTPNLIKIVKQIKDERQHRGQRYTTEVIIWILILGVLLGGDSLVSIYALFVYKKKLRKIIYKLIGKKLNNIPHPTTISRALGKISLEGLIEGLSLDQLGEELEDELHVAGDGKVMRGIHDGSKRQILSFVSQHLLPLYQVELDTKENEITALVNLLKEHKLDLPPGTLFTLDAIHTQTQIIKHLQKRGFEYLLKVKANQKELKGQLEYIFHQGVSDKSYPLKTKTYDQFEKKHDRLTTWKVTTSTDFNSQDLPKGFESVKTIGFIKTSTQRPIYAKYTGEKSYTTSTNTTYFISSVAKKPQELFNISRNHWRVEKLHWLKDNLYLEDKQTLKGKSAYFLTFIKSLAISLISQLSSKISHTIRRLKFDDVFLIKSLNQLGIM